VIEGGATTVSARDGEGWAATLIRAGMGRRDGFAAQVLPPSSAALGECDEDSEPGATDECLRRLELDRGTLVEWWKNGVRGIEHGFDVAVRPAGAGELAIRVAVEGLVAEPDGETGALLRENGELRLSYSGLTAFDASGEALPARMEVRPDEILLVIDDSDAVYPIVIDPLLTTPAWTAESDRNNAEFGRSVASAGDVNGDGFSDVAVGSPYFENGEDTDGCAYPGEDVQCRAPSCTDGVAVLEASCAGTGSCPDERTQVCAPYVCAEDLCDGDCAEDGDCDESGFCSAGECEEDLDDGESCDRDDMCANGHCVDGVCCDAACEGQCEACDVEGSEGECTAVTGDPHGGRDSCGGSEECAGTCDGRETQECTMPGDETECSEGSCEDGVMSPPGTCDGAGWCEEADDVPCDPYVCADEHECLASCGGSDDCAEGFECEDSECVSVGADGDADADGDGDADSDADGDGGTSGGGCDCGAAGRPSAASVPLAAILLAGLLALLLADRRR
jgi:hypothetical protein